MLLWLRERLLPSAEGLGTDLACVMTRRPRPNACGPRGLLLPRAPSSAGLYPRDRCRIIFSEDFNARSAPPPVAHTARSDNTETGEVPEQIDG
jgi:hypothetical protein